MTLPEDEGELLRLLIENLEEFREATVETFKVLHRKQKLLGEQIHHLQEVSDLHGMLLWLILGVAIIGLVGLLILLLT